MPLQAAAAHPQAGLSRQELSTKCLIWLPALWKKRVRAFASSHTEKFLQPNLHLAVQGSVLCADGTGEPGKLEPPCQLKLCFPQSLFACEACGIRSGTQKKNLLNYAPLQVQRSPVCGAQTAISVGQDSWWQIFTFPPPMETYYMV